MMIGYKYRLCAGRQRDIVSSGETLIRTSTAARAKAAIDRWMDVQREEVDKWANVKCTLSKH